MLSFKLAPGLPLLRIIHLGWILCGGGQQAPKHSSFVETHRLSEEPGGTSLD